MKKKNKSIKEKKMSLWDWVDEIRKYKKITPEDLKYDTKIKDDFKSFNQYMILKSLAMNPELIFDLDRYINGNTMRKFPKESFFFLLQKVIERDKRFHKFIKSKKDVDVDFDVERFYELYPHLSIKNDIDIIKFFEDDIKEEIERIYR